MIDELVALSNRYGADGELVLAGGGNTSAKSGRFMYVKGSGTSLATITADGFVKIDRDKLNVIFNKKYSENDSEREAQVLGDLMASRCEGDANKRPSVETTLHALFEQTFVLHLHPALVNGITCSRSGEKAARRVIKRDFIWVDSCKPGYILAMICKEKMDEFKAEKGKSADIIVLQNHGIFFAADTVGELDLMLGEVMLAAEAALVRKPFFVSKEPTIALRNIAGTLTDGLDGINACELITNNDAVLFCGNENRASNLMYPFTPDHIVYCKAYPLLMPRGSDVLAASKLYKDKYGFYPRVILCEGLGIICTGENVKQAKTAKLLFEDAIKIAVYSESFGGPRHMTEELVDFIVNWEVESYRSSQSK